MWVGGGGGGPADCLELYAALLGIQYMAYRIGLDFIVEPFVASLK